MNQITKFSIVASFIGLWVNSIFSVSTQIIIGFILIFTFGVLHGANDLMLIKKTNPNQDAFAFKKTVAFYTISVLLGGLLFYFLPTFALVSFVLVSGYHFGEQHWMVHLKFMHWTDALFYLSYGLLILGLLFIFHAQEVTLIIEHIIGHKIPGLLIEIYFYVSLFLFLILLAFKTIQSKNLKTIVVRELFLLLVLAIIFKTSTLIWGFSLYFILWHSVPSMKDQIQFLYEGFNLENFIKYVKAAFLYWVFALIGIVVVYLLLNESQIFEALIFSFLASITFPHVWVIISMFKTKNPLDHNEL
jgi:Brp/Blh family beta-carotene 15,15'-monooxygenase